MATMDDLAPELLLIILHSVDRPRDLHALISTHSKCYYVFDANRKRVLTSVLKKAIPEGALRDALFACYAPPPTPYYPISPPEILSYPFENDIVDPQLRLHSHVRMSRYFTGDEPSFPTDIPDPHRLAGLSSLVDRFTDDYRHHVARILGKRVGPGDGGNWGPPVHFAPLSPDERTRIQRAFYRYEFYCRLFKCYDDPRYPVLREGSSLFCAWEQNNLFVRRMDPWAVEEMSCIHNYLLSLAGDCVRDLEDRVVAALFLAPGGNIQLGHSATGPRKRRRVRFDLASFLTKKTKARKIKDTMVPFDLRPNGNLGLFARPETTTTREKLPAFTSKLTSYGLAYMRRLIDANTITRCAIMRSEEPFGCDFLPEAVAVGPIRRPSLGSDMPPHWTNDDARRALESYSGFLPAACYMGFHRRAEMANGITRYGLVRDRGYPFWGAKRFSEPAIAGAFRAAAQLVPGDVEARPREKKSVLDRVEDVRLPLSEKWRIVEEFRFCNMTDDGGG